MKIITYNLHFGGKGRVHWNEIIEEFNPEILLIQESYAPKEHLSPILHGTKHQLFVPASWAQHLRACSVPSSPRWDDLSDHNPVVAEFDCARVE